MACQVVVLPLYLGFFVRCPTADFAGVTAPYPASSSPLAAGVGLHDGCNAGCGCSVSDFDPVCAGDGAGGEVAFFNPCFAGCSSSGGAAGNGSHFGDCSCVPGDGAAGGLAARGYCESAK